MFLNCISDHLISPFLEVPCYGILPLLFSHNASSLRFTSLFPGLPNCLYIRTHITRPLLLHPSVLAALSWWEACFGPPAPGKVTSPYISKDTSGKPVFHFLGCLCILSSVCLATTNIQYKYGRIRVHVGTTFQLYRVSHLTRGVARPFLEPWVPWAPWTRVRQLGAVLLWHRLKLWFKLWFSAYLVKWEDDLWS